MSHKVTLNWNEPSSDDPPTTFQVNRGTVSGQETSLAQVPATQTTYEDDTVVGGEQYFYTVQAVNADGSSAPSMEASTTIPLALPPVPQALTLTAS